MRQAYQKDIWRTIVKTKRRFLSILIITVLGVTMLTGLKAGCVDLRQSADHFYDEQNLYDIKVVSTLGLTKDDVKALARFKEIQVLEGSYEETLVLTMQKQKQRIGVKTVSEQGINQPYIKVGRLPEKANEIAVSEKYSKAVHAKLNDSITFDEAKDSVLHQQTFIITGIILDPMNISVDEGATSFRSTSQVDDTFFVSKSAYDNNIYSSIYITLKDTKELMCYEKTYEQRVHASMDKIGKEIKQSRENARSKAMKQKAVATYQENKKKMDRQFSKAQEELDAAKAAVQAAQQAVDQPASNAQTQQAREKVLQENLALQKQQQSLTKKKREAYAQLATAKEAIDTMPKAIWYVQDRKAIDSYTSVQSDASSIETVGTAFPIVFLAVAMLISLTTITRMVEEERGLIGTYKALGFSYLAIYGKYVIYACAACLLGGILGDVCGFLLLPKFLFTIFQVLYKLPVFTLCFDYVYGVGGVALFVVCIVTTAYLACRVELRLTPAVLMRPKAPHSGSRVLLERFPAIWKKLSFLNKVTLRNLFRFKKRMIMTITGIMGCTALVLCGFAIRDSVNDLMPGQYEKLYQYDFMSVVKEDAYARIHASLAKDAAIKDYVGIRIDTVKVKAAMKGQEETVQLMVFPDDKAINGYIGLRNREGEAIPLKDGIYITQNVASVLGFDVQDHIYLQNMAFIEKEVPVKAIVQNYLGNVIYMNQKTYAALFGKYQPNGFLAHFHSAYQKEIPYAKDFAKQQDVLSAVSTKKLKQQFAEAFSLINVVVYLITFMAAGLAFVVLFTLSTTNISERERELATIKVLGFYEREVHLYVNKEILILTLFGILLGLPLGRVLSGMLTDALRMPSIHFAISVHGLSYVYAAGLSLLFALIVNIITNRTLNDIHMVESLKSLE